MRRETDHSIESYERTRFHTTYSQDYGHCILMKKGPWEGERKGMSGGSNLKSSMRETSEGSREDVFYGG